MAYQKHPQAVHDFVYARMVTLDWPHRIKSVDKRQLMLDTKGM